MPLTATRTLVLMPVAIALNVALGSTVQQALKLPLYLDSLGTVIAGVLGGPLVGAVTGLLSDLIWAYVLPPPLAAPTAGPFAVTAAIVGLLAGVFGRAGLFRIRPVADRRSLLLALVASLVVLMLALYTFSRAYGSPQTFSTVTGNPAASFAASRLAFGFISLVFGGLVIWTLFWRRDAGALLALTCGLLTGLAAALVSAPIAAYVFGGVTGFGGDALVAAFRAAGASLFQATLQQGLLSDPLDKMVTFLIAFLVLAGLPRRVVSRFPNGDRLTEAA